MQTNKMNNENFLSFDDFLKTDIRVGTIIEAYDFPEARKPALQLVVDFGPEIGFKKTSAQITVHYSKETVLGKQIVAVVNFPPKQIGKFMSECLVLGAVAEDGSVVLLETERITQNGLRIA
jgi:tRNA-binding protein